MNKMNYLKLFILSVVVSLLLAGTCQEAKFDLNSATRRQLESISGIGPGMAHRIIVERNRRGGFRKIEDLLKIQGVGRKTLVQLRKKLFITESANVKEKNND